MKHSITPRIAILLAALSVAVPASALTGYGLTDENDILSFDLSTPGVLTGGGAVRGLGGEDLIGIDFRPSNGLLYGVGNLGGIFTISTTNFQATRVSTLSIPNGGFLSGSRFGVDFNPVVDRLRLVSDTDQSLAVNVDTGAAVVNGSVNPAAGANVTGSAYTGNFAGSTATTLYGINVNPTGNASLVTQNTATGTITTVGTNLGFNFTSLSGFDIVTIGNTNQAYGIFQNKGDGFSGLYSVNLTTGTATSLGAVGGGDMFDGFAIAPVPEPASMAALALGAAGLLRRRRKA